MGRITSPGIVYWHEQDGQEPLRRVGAPVLRPEAEGGLVAVMPIGNPDAHRLEGALDTAYSDGVGQALQQVEMPFGQVRPSSLSKRLQSVP